MSSTGLIALVIYGDVKSLSLSPVYRTHEKQGKRTLEPCILYSIRHKRLDARVCIWDPRYRLHACSLQAGVYSGLTGCVAYPRLGVGYTLNTFLHSPHLS